MKTGFHLLVTEGSVGDYSRAHFLLFSLETVQARSVYDITAELHVVQKLLTTIFATWTYFIRTVTHTSAVNVQYRAPNLKMQDYVQSHTFTTSPCCSCTSVTQEHRWPTEAYRKNVFFSFIYGSHHINIFKTKYQSIFQTERQTSTHTHNQTYGHCGSTY